MRIQYQINVSLLPSLGFVFLTFGLIQIAVVYQSAMDAARYQLESVALLQSNRLRSALRQQDSLVSSVASRTQLRTLMKRWSESPDSGTSAGIQRILADAAERIDHLEDVLALDTGGRVIASSSGLPPGTPYRPPPVIRGSDLAQVMTRTGHRQDLFARRADGTLLQLLFADAEIDGQGVGHIVMEMVPAYIEALEEDYVGMGETGETLLAQRDRNGDAEILSPIRFATDSRYGRVIPQTASRLPLQLAFSGQQDFFSLVIDYRSQPVVAATRQIPEFGMALVAKRDRQEVLRPVIVLVTITGITLVVTLIAFGLLSNWLARSISRPIHQIARECQDLLRERDVALLQALGTNADEATLLRAAIRELRTALFAARQETAETGLRRLEKARREENLPDPESNRGEACD